jgi:hypothetical protein
LATITWRDIFSGDMSDGLVCPVLRRVIDMSEDFGIAGDCSCDGGAEGGFNINCSFKDQCTDENLCGSVDLEFGFDSVGSAEGKVCSDFSEVEHPETCSSFKCRLLIALARQNVQPPMEEPPASVKSMKTFA